MSNYRQFKTENKKSLKINNKSVDDVIMTSSQCNHLCIRVVACCNFDEDWSLQSYRNCVLKSVYKVNAKTAKSRKTAPLKSRGLRLNRNIFMKYYLIFSILGICRVKWKRKKIRFLFPSASNFRPKLGTPHWWRSIIECSRKTCTNPIHCTKWMGKN